MHFTFENDVLTIETTAPVTLTLWGKTLCITDRQVCSFRDFFTSTYGTATTGAHHDA